ncbi:MAG: cytochrome c [Candidatus Nitronauta litoralis]|uniref:Cytochrome c n=1 Tax=Candidatus Nitronauta litoralis TaxID=2705533 RepID=A0A7T0BYQ4_9BACT|nr:MAG: cytochrome c [Candidatus Nitronauta litoralis]
MKFPFFVRSLPLLLVLFLPNTAFASDIKEQAEKIVMMLNIVNKEYHEGVKDGKIINADEYGESQVFLAQSEERYQGISEKGQDIKSASKLAAKFKSLSKIIASKKDPAQISKAVQNLNAGLVKQFGLTIFKSPRKPVSLAKGKTIYQKNCVVCHGPTGQGDGPKAKGLEPAPARLADPQLTGDGITDPYDNFQIISVGIANTAMQGWADTLSEEERWDVTFFVRTFSNKLVKLPAIQKAAATENSGATGENPEKVLEEIKNLLEKSRSAYEKEKVRPARLAVIDAYLVFEPVEQVLLEKNRKVGKGIERTFGELQTQMKKKAPYQDIETTINKINLDLKSALPLLQ